MLPSLRIGTLLGTSIRVHWTWPIALGLTTVLLAVWLLPEAYPGWWTATYWAAGTIAAALLFASVLTHEVSHCLVAHVRGVTVKSFTLFTFGGISNVQESATSPIGELVLAIVGPLTNITLGMASSLLAVFSVGISEPLTAILICLGVFNLLLGILNLVPGFPLDGGRLLRTLLWFLSGDRVRPTSVAIRVGQIAAWLLVVAGVGVTLIGGPVTGLIMLVAGLLVVGVTGRGYQQTVREEELL